MWVVPSYILVLSKQNFFLRKLEKKITQTFFNNIFSFNYTEKLTKSEGFLQRQAQKACQYSQNWIILNEMKICLAVPYSFCASGLQPAIFL